MTTPTSTKAMLTQMAEEAKELKAAAGGPLTDMVAGWLVPRYVEAMREQLASAPENERWKTLRLAASDLVALRRCDHAAERLALDREKFEESVRRQRAAESAAERMSEPRGLYEKTLHGIEHELGLI